MSDIEIWAQGCKVKGLRVIRFEVIQETNFGRRLLWLGPLGEADDDQKFFYSRRELMDNGWERLE